jgi:hypothetical protein
MGDDETAPLDHFIDEQNLEYDYRLFKSRRGSELSITTAFAVNRTHVYKRTGEADRLLILDNAGNLYDSAIGFVSPILAIATMTDFSIVTINNRAYITPHDRNRGIPSEKVYVYQGSGTARSAAGAAPSGFSLGVATSASSGHVEAATYLFAVCFVSDTGYISPPGPAIFTSYVAPGSMAIHFTNIPIGPTGTTSRKLVCTMALPTDYDGNQFGQEYFFIPDGEIADNVTTELDNISFYQSELLASADYLFDELAEIPAGVGIGIYQGRLIVWGSNTNPLTINVSKKADYESFDSVDGIIQVTDDGAGSVRNAREFRQILYIHKSRKTYYVQDNDADPSLWKVNDIDQSVGTECFGIANILGQDGALLDYYLMADRKALRLVEGTFKVELSGKIENQWDRINKAAFDTIQVAIDSTRNQIYVAVPLDAATSPSHILMGDYARGLTPEGIKWSTWLFPDAPKSIVVDVNNTTKKPVFKFARAAGNVYALSETNLNDYGTAISYFARTAYMSFNPSIIGPSQFVAAILRAIGVGSIQLTMYGLDDSNPQSPGSYTLGLTPGQSYQMDINYVSEMASFKFVGGFSSGNYFKSNRITLFGSPIWNENPH